MKIKSIARKTLIYLLTTGIIISNPINSLAQKSVTNNFKTYSISQLEDYLTTIKEIYNTNKLYFKATNPKSILDKTEQLPQDIKFEIKGFYKDKIELNDQLEQTIKEIQNYIKSAQASKTN